MTITHDTQTFSIQTNKPIEPKKMTLNVSEKDQKMMLSQIGDFLFTSKYARYLPDEQRRETWLESVARVEEMHLDKYDYISDDRKAQICKAFDLVRERQVLPSMRSMQFGGKAILAHNSKIFNCCTRHVDSIRAFSEIFYLLLCGSGVGIGLSKKFLGRLPDLVGPNDKTGTVITYVIEDSIEGWADSIEALLNCYFVNTAYSGRKVIFDYSRIRPPGTPLKTGGGRAPGYKGLKAAHVRIKRLLDNTIEDRNIKRLRSIDAYDVLMHTSDAVLSGGVRRAATSVIFDKDDELMLNAKTGDWFKENPQRGRSNNSVLLIRDELDEKEFQEIFKRTKEWGEPGFVFADHPDTLFNPCQPAWAPVLTPSGISTMGEISEGDKIWSETGWTTVTKKWATGTKDVYRYSTTAGTFYGTKEHRVVSNGKKIEVESAESIDILRGEKNWLNHDDLIGDDILAGQVVGDELTSLSERVVPEKYFSGSPLMVAGFLRGLYDVNGLVVGNKVTLKTSSAVLSEQTQMMLSSLGIGSYYTKVKSVQSHNVNITTDRALFYRMIGFIQQYEMGKLDNECSKAKVMDTGKLTSDIISSEYISTEEVFDITVDNEPHTYWSGGVNVSNCFEISFIPVTDDGVCGVQYCNLSTINGSKVKTVDDFLRAAKAAALIGTLQAGYTDFPYLSNAAKHLTEEESLIGVSITGMLQNPNILLDGVSQNQAAHAVVEVNKEWASVIGINPAARTTAIKPEGTGSWVGGTPFTGIHAAHSPNHFRRVQMNRIDPVFQYFKSINPHMVEEGVWSANKTDDIITFPISVSEGIMKSDLSAIEHLEIIKATQNNWVIPGATEHNKKPIHNNVSCTVIVNQNEWEDVAKYLYYDRHSFAAVSLLAKSGDKDFAQAPFEAVTTQEDVLKFQNLLDNMIPVNYEYMVELGDGTTHSQEISCAGSQCEINL